MTDAREIVNAMCVEKVGGARAEWANKEKNVAWIYWKRPEEWAEVISQWVRTICTWEMRVSWSEVLTGMI